MSTKLEINKVNRFDAGWDPATLFTGFRVRATLKASTDTITNINNVSALQKKLRREVGEEGTDWLLQTNPLTNIGELYLVNSGKLVMWKLQDHEKFSTLFDKVEQHKDNLDEVREDS
jgi:hypothetical protein